MSVTGVRMSILHGVILPVLVLEKPVQANLKKSLFLLSQIGLTLPSLFVLEAGIPLPILSMTDGIHQSRTTAFAQFQEPILIP